MPVQANKLYLFRPSPKWAYCGGATLICANSLFEAVGIGNLAVSDDRTSDSIYNNEINAYYDAVSAGQIIYCEENIPKHPGTFIGDGEFTVNGDGMDIWQFVREFTLAEPMNVGVVFSNFQCA